MIEICFYHIFINANEILGEFVFENMISSHVKITSELSLHVGVKITARAPFLAWGDFTRARVSLALLSLRKNGGLLVVYFACEKITIALVQYNNSHFYITKIIHLISEMVKYFSGL